MRRVVITGMGIVSCLGNDTDSVTRSLREGRSGIRFKEDYKELGMRSHVAGTPEIALDDFIDRKPRRFMGDAAAYAYIAMQQAITDAGDDGYTITTVNGGTLTATVVDGNVVLTDAAGGTATVTATDVAASNGVIHVIDTVLMPQ